MKFHVDGWDPAYGSAMEDVGEATTTVESSARIDAAVETQPEHWAPVVPRPACNEPGALVFVDGVRRIEARVWIPDSEDTGASMGVAASYASGAVCCCASQGAHVLVSEHRRGLFSSNAYGTDVATRAGLFRAHHAPIDESESPAVTLSAALQRELLTLELIAAAQARAAVTGHLSEPDTDLLVVDGPLRSRDHLPRALGFIKTHRAIYLPPELNAVVGQLGTGERTPVFLMGTSWDRYAWYLRLPCRPGSPWAGVVRVECAARLTSGEATKLANLSQSLLPRYSSVEYKDPRAPQNLVPIAGLERHLRRRLGDQKLVYRALQRAAAQS